MSPAAYFTTVSLLLASFFLVLYRIFRAPHAVDRVVALDLLALVAAALIGTHAVDSGVEAFLDAVLVLSIIAFLSTVVLARSVEGFIRKREEAAWKP